MSGSSAVVTLLGRIVEGAHGALHATFIVTMDGVTREIPCTCWNKSGTMFDSDAALASAQIGRGRKNHAVHLPIQFVHGRWIVASSTVTLNRQARITGWWTIREAGNRSAHNGSSQGRLA